MESLRAYEIQRQIKMVQCQKKTFWKHRFQMLYFYRDNVRYVKGTDLSYSFCYFIIGDMRISYLPSGLICPSNMFQRQQRVQRMKCNASYAMHSQTCVHLHHCLSSIWPHWNLNIFLVLQGIFIHHFYIGDYLSEYGYNSI